VVDVSDALRLQDHDDTSREDHFVQLHNVSWADYLRFEAVRGDMSAPRMTLLDGTLEFTSPSFNHDSIKSVLRALVEAYCFERALRFHAVGAWTQKSEEHERAAEPDECFLFGEFEREVDPPHLAIEVVWTHGPVDKLAVYSAVGIGEVWYWRRGRIHIHLLEGGAYVEAERSRVLPGLDVQSLCEYVGMDTYDAVLAFRETLRG